MIINRVKSPANRNTFVIKPIRELVQRYVGDGKNWIDPFSGDNSPSEFTNDLNPDKPTKYHMEALEFCKLFKDKKFKGALFDPPYSVRQIKECYNNFGIKEFNGRCDFYSKIKDILSEIIEKEGLSISFGWNSVGFGERRGFKIVEILMVCHSGQHNDTIVTVEKKTKDISNFIIRESEPKIKDLF